MFFPANISFFDRGGEKKILDTLCYNNDYLFPGQGYWVTNSAYANDMRLYLGGWWLAYFDNNTRLVKVGFSNEYASVPTEAQIISSTMNSYSNIFTGELPFNSDYITTGQQLQIVLNNQNALTAKIVNDILIDNTLSSNVFKKLTSINRTNINIKNFIKKQKYRNYIPIFTGIFGGMNIINNTIYIFPQSAEIWAGVANVNFDIYPLTFEYGGKIIFSYRVVDPGVDVHVRFRIEKNPYPDVLPDFNTTWFSCNGQGTGEIRIPSQGNNTFSSLLLYLQERDRSIELTNFIVQSNLI